MPADFIRAPTQSFELPMNELHFSYARSSGPGGQNVNKVNSKTVLYWNIPSSAALTPDQKLRVQAQLQNRINQEGDLILTSDCYRDQEKNRDDCIEKLLEMITPCLHPPRKRKKTKPSRSSVVRGKQGKKKLSEKKNLRSRVRY